MRRKNKGFGEQQLREGRRERKKDSAVDEAGLTQNRKGKGFFEVQCSNLSLVPVIVQHLPQLISVKTPLPFSSHSHPPSLTPTINKETSLLISRATTTQAHILLLKY